MPKIVKKNWWMRVKAISSQTWDIFGDTLYTLGYIIAELGIYNTAQLSVVLASYYVAVSKSRLCCCRSVTVIRSTVPCSPAVSPG